MQKNLLRTILTAISGFISETFHNFFGNTNWCRRYQFSVNIFVKDVIAIAHFHRPAVYRRSDRVTQELSLRLKIRYRRAK